MRVLVTGATGLLGANTCEALLAAGHDVRAAVRARSRTLGLDDLDVERVALDLDDGEALRRALAGCDGLVHAAAAVWIGRTGRAWLEEVNVQGTERVLAAAAQIGVGRVVHVSSVDALGLPDDGRPGDEDTPPNLAHVGCGYVDTKRAAEEVALAWAARGLPVVVVNPTYLLGPRDARPSSGEMVLAVGAGRGLFAPPGGNDFVDVRDVARSLVVALERGVPGRRYVLGGVSLSYREAWRRIAAVVGARGPIATAPRSAAWLAGQLGGAWGRLSGREPSVNPISVRMSFLPHYFSSERARRELGHPETDLDAAIGAAWDWFGRHGYR